MSGTERERGPAHRQRTARDEQQRTGAGVGEPARDTHPGDGADAEQQPGRHRGRAARRVQQRRQVGVRGERRAVHQRAERERPDDRVPAQDRELGAQAGRG